jgi:hypothetical protein
MKRLLGILAPCLIGLLLVLPSSAKAERQTRLSQNLDAR